VIGAETVIVGHALDNDFRALQMVHVNFIDTSMLFQIERAHNYAIGLVDTVKQVFDIEFRGDRLKGRGHGLIKRIIASSSLYIQCGFSFADNIEDAAWPLELARWASDKINETLPTTKPTRRTLRDLFRLTLPAYLRCRMLVFNIPAGLCSRSSKRPLFPHALDFSSGITQADLVNMLGLNNTPSGRNAQFSQIRRKNLMGSVRIDFATDAELISVFRALPCKQVTVESDNFLSKPLGMPAGKVAGTQPVRVKILHFELPAEEVKEETKPVVLAAPVVVAVAPATPTSAAAATSAARTPGGSDVTRIKVVRGAFDDATPGKARGVKVTGDAAEVHAAIAAAAGFDAAAKLIVTDSEGDVVSVPSGLVADQTYFVDLF
jgi:hypothetical protein